VEKEVKKKNKRWNLKEADRSVMVMTREGKRRTK